jgi:hypothetical protein
MSAITPEMLRRSAALYRNTPGMGHVAVAYERTAELPEKADALDAGKGVEGQETDSHQEGSSMSHRTECNVTDTISGRLAARVEQGEDSLNVPMSIEGSGALEVSRPWWSVPDLDTEDEVPSRSWMQSEQILQPLRRGRGMQFGSKLQQAHLASWLRQPVREVVPMVSIGRFGVVDEVMKYVPGSTINLDLDEAERFAHDLLLLVEVARAERREGAS